MSSQTRDIPGGPIAANLISEMARVGATNADVARALKVSERQVTRWRGGQEPRYRFVALAARYFGRSPDWFYVDHHDNQKRAA